MKTLTTIPTRIAAVALAIALGFAGLTALPAGANPFGGPDGLSTCTDLDENGIPQCDHPGHGDDEDEDQEVPDAPVDDPVIADPTFTG